MPDDSIEISWDPDDLNDGAHEEDVVCEFEFRIIRPRTGATAAVEDEGMAVALAVNRVAAEVGGGRIDVVDPSDFSPQAKHLPKGACRIRMQRYIRDASLVIVVAIGPSSTMGAENELRGNATVPCMLVTRVGAELGAAFESRLEPTISTIRYESLHDLISQLRTEVRRILPDLRAAKNSRQEAYKAIGGAKVPPYLFIHRMLADLTLSELSRRASICEVDLRALERDPLALAEASYLKIHRIAGALAVHVQASPDNGPALYGNTNVDEHVIESLKNLYAVLREDRKWIPCETVLEAWEEYKEVVKFGQESDAKELSTAEPRKGDKDSRPVQLIWEREQWKNALDRAGRPNNDGTLPYRTDIDQ